MATTALSSSSSTPVTVGEKPIIVRVKRKVGLSLLDAFWLEVTERPFKRLHLDLKKLSISDSEKKEELRPKKVLVRHVETVANSEATVGIVQWFLDSASNELTASKGKIEERRNAFKKDNKKDQLLSKAVQQQRVAAENARFEQVWRRRKKGDKEGIHDEELHEMCHFYDVVRVDVEERSKTEPVQEPMCFEDQKMLASYLPLLREFLPAAVEEIESDIGSYLSKQTEEYVYDYYAVNDETSVGDDDAMHPFPIVQVEDEDFYDGPDDDSEYATDDSNAEQNPRNEYPDEMSGEEEGEDDGEREEEEEEEEESEASDESEDENPLDRYMQCKGMGNEDDIWDDYAEDESDFGDSEDEKNDEYRNWSCR